MPTPPDNRESSSGHPQAKSGEFGAMTRRPWRLVWERALYATAAWRGV